MSENVEGRGPMLCLTMCAYRKAGLGEEEYRKYMTEVHAPRVRSMLVKYGIDKYSMAHNQNETRSLMGEIFDAQFANIADYDCIIQIQFRDVQQFVQLKEDPEYQKIIAPDHERFADTKRTK
ncbi:hypothetical protein PHISCL_08041 [Aspergillus sclerotialis]|uniref:EthD domain-containing protein n=1 Tax=Aspergillus sclerotialis TaxID=2070753 RepID=A0A3A2ZBJ4_9EURO|nr:hypothetical protein PHISCL_08041 [Aspergillus sclerotialis]